MTQGGAGASREPLAVPAGLESVLRSWSRLPGLEPLAQRVRSAAAGGHLERFRGALAEVAMARHLLERGAQLTVDIETPAGRTADFEVRKDELHFFLHVKSLRASPPRRSSVRYSSRLRMLERIERPFVVAVRWRDGITDEEDARLVQRIGSFLRSASLGEELVVRDEAGTEIGGCRVMAPSEHRHVTLVIGLPSGFADEVERVERLFRRAYRQFMPGALNVISIALPTESLSHDFEAALLGTPIERWDRFPQAGERVAHGRAPDGFWSGHRFDRSRFASWYCWTGAAELVRAALYVRPNLRPARAAESQRTTPEQASPGHATASTARLPVDDVAQANDASGKAAVERALDERLRELLDMPAPGGR